MVAFPTYFDALWGHSAFPWQTMLAERVASGEWPTVLDLPTASGKTACIDIALYALAAQADRATARRTAPRRIWFVVDRRIVVDEAYARSERIARKLGEATSGPLRAIADRLRAIAGTDRPLAVARLRGGVLRDDGWARLPSQPAVITSTVDQLGSRLLFRGYGHSLLAAPVYAGLAANDSLILLDEAHCALPFMQTLQAVARYRGPAWATDPLPAPFGFAILSATPPHGIPPQEVFPGTERSRALDHPTLHQRLRASKPAQLVTVEMPRAPRTDPLIAEAASRAARYVGGGKRRVAVMVNRVRTAQGIAAALRESGTEADVVLLTGRLRPFEGNELVGRWSPYLRANRPEEPAKPIMVVSTQTLEVGADFSFDALVAEAASLDALRQRFGRLDRLGSVGDAEAAVVVRSRDADPERAEPDRVYGGAIAQTWKLLTELASDGVVDFGVEALRAALSAAEDLSPCFAPSTDAPLLLPAHLDLLCQTAPAPAPEPDVQLYLHGKDRSAPEVQVVWRADLPEHPRTRADDQAWLEAVALAPPVSGEMLSAPLYRLRAFLARTGEGEDTGDVEGAPDQEAESPPRSRPFVLWRGRDRLAVLREPARISPNDIVVVPAAYGMGELGQPALGAGLGTDRLDLWERALDAAGKPAAVRLNRGVLAPWESWTPLAALLRLVNEPEPDREAIGDGIDAVLDYAPAEDAASPAPPEWWRRLLRRVRSGRMEVHPAGGVVLYGRRTAGPGHGTELDLFADDDDLTSAAGREVSLDQHSDLVERTAARLVGLCLKPEYLEPVQLAARWHDAGKLDERFQTLLRQGDLLAALSADAPLAKSAFVPASPARRRQIREASGLPPGFRHEMLSVQLMERVVPRPDDADAWALALHLVASHHGHARPFAPVCIDREPPPVSGARDGVRFALGEADRAVLPPPHRLDSGIPDRFWKLVRRYGWWGLAYLEAMVRLSDWYASELAEERAAAAPAEERV